MKLPFCIYVTEHFTQYALQYIAFTFKTNHPLFFSFDTLDRLEIFAVSMCVFFPHKAVDQLHVENLDSILFVFSLFAHFFPLEGRGAGREGFGFGTFQYASNQQLGSSHIRKLLITANCGHYHGKIK